MLTPIKSGRYISIKADGLLHEKVSKETDGAVLREYETSDGQKGEKWELLYRDIKDVFLKNVGFEPSEYGENILLTLSDGENEVILSENTSTNFGTDIMKKLPNVNFAEKLTIAPYSFTDTKGKAKKGVSIYQKSDKVADHFWDGVKKLNGFPEPEGDTSAYDSDDWKMHFIKVRKFLTAYIKEQVVPLFEKGIETDFISEKDFEYPEGPKDPPTI